MQFKKSKSSNLNYSLRNNTKFRRFYLNGAGILIFTIIYAWVPEAKQISREQLIADARQLVTILESVHPDPYSGGGGKIAFHLRFQQLLYTIPEEGMTGNEFYKLLLPFIAALRDGHTKISMAHSVEVPKLMLPLELEIVENQIYVVRVFSKDHKHLLGSTISSVASIPFEVLVERQERLAGYENKYTNLHYLRNNLSSASGLESLLPECKNETKINITFRTKSGNLLKTDIDLVDNIPGEWIELSSKIQLPKKEIRNPDFIFTDSTKQVVILRIDNMVTYREAFEAFRNTGYTPAEEWAKTIYNRFNKNDLPEKYDDVIKGIPSLTETLKTMVKEMKQANTETLLIDLRRNGGGHSIMCDILFYFLYGFEVYHSVSKQLSIEKLSEIMFSQNANRSLEIINEDRPIPLITNDYLFDNELLSSDGEDNSKAYTQEEIVNYYQSWTPTFAAEVETSQFESFFTPHNIFVITSPRTYSGGYWLAVYFYKAGATLIGVPSGQAGNHYGNVLRAELKNSGIELYVSSKQFLFFHDNPEQGKELRPHYEMTYEILASYNFDPNADILYVLDLIANRKSR